MLVIPNLFVYMDQSLHSVHNKIYYIIKLHGQHAVIVCHVEDSMLEPEVLSHTVPPKDNCGGLGAVHMEGRAETPVKQEPRHVDCDSNHEHYLCSVDALCSTNTGADNPT